MAIIKEPVSFTKDCFIKNKLFSEISSFGIGGKIAYYYEPTSIDDFINCIEYASSIKLDYKIVGNATNILCADSGFNGLIISTKNLKNITMRKNFVRAECGVKLSSLIEFGILYNLGGLEALYGIPASIGGAITMNASAFQFNVGLFVKNVCCLIDNKKQILKAEDCLFNYRNSIFKQKQIPILYVDFNMQKIEKEQSKKRIGEYLKLRGESQPTGKSCGSVFQNPMGYTAGRIIESVNLKGYRTGGAIISNKHANFIINENNASGKDVYFLIDTVKKKVKKIFNIDLKEEIEYLGDFNGVNG